MLFLKIFLLLDLLALNLAVVYLNFKPVPAPPAPICQSSCPSPTSVPSLMPSPIFIPITSSQAAPKKTIRVTYLPVPGNGSQLSYGWYSLPGTDFYFNPADFPGLKSIVFEANIRLLNGNGTAFVRLYDTTNNFVVQNSQIQTNNQTSTAVISSPVTFYSGRGLIKVQVKSLTADTSIFDSGRLKITTEN